MIDGSNKGRYSTKGELLVLRHCNEVGEIEVRALGMAFLS